MVDAGKGDHGPVRAETHPLHLPSFHFLEPTVNPFPSQSELIDGSCFYLMLVLESALLLLFWGGDGVGRIHPNTSKRENIFQLHSEFLSIY